MAGTTPTVLRHHGWSALLKDLRRRPRLTFLNQVNRELTRRRLAHVAGLVRWLALAQPALLDWHELRLLIAGVAEVERLDDGRWLALLPYLLDRPQMAVAFDIVDPELAKPFAPIHGRHQPWP